MTRFPQFQEIYRFYFPLHHRVVFNLWITQKTLTIKNAHVKKKEKPETNQRISNGRCGRAVLWDRFDWDSNERTDPLATSADLLLFGREQLPPSPGWEDSLPRALMGHIQYCFFKNWVIANHQGVAVFSALLNDDVQTCDCTSHLRQNEGSFSGPGLKASNLLGYFYHTQQTGWPQRVISDQDEP